MGEVTIDPEAVAAAAGSFAGFQPVPGVFPAAARGDEASAVVQAAIAAWPGTHVDMFADRAASAARIVGAAELAATVLPAADSDNATQINSVTEV
ncbi:MAG TPA: hypothetical protein VMU34_24040 [Mycobacterium sp.]|nr:hypothetical protein [Mycobacterium sp.]